MAASASAAHHDTARNANLVAAAEIATTEAHADLLNASTRCDHHRIADRFLGTFPMWLACACC